MKTIKVRATGAVEIVSDEYFEAYQPGGWFFEIPAEVPVTETPKKTRAKKEEPKE